jgi:serine/threonine-protein kinase
MSSISLERWRELEPLLDETLELEPDQRTAHLVSRCGGDAALRSDLERLLRTCESAERSLTRPAAVACAELLVEPIPVPEDARVGPYRIVGAAGHGGMGTVFLAERDDDQYAKRVALKLLRSDFVLDVRLINRFREERQILATLDHPHIARLLDGGVTPDGLPWFALELVAGTPITRYADAHRLRVEERLRLFLDVCEAVQYAHRNLIVHRDLKPSNILVTDDGVVKLLDFGIAKLIASESAATADATLTGPRPLTPEYASPEQLRGDPVTVGSDVYSLGVVLCELLVGRRPFAAGGRPLFELERQVLEEEPRRPSDLLEIDGSVQAAARNTTPERLRRRLRGDLDAIVLTALRKEPQRRYATVDRLAADLRRALDGLPVRARPDTWRYRAAKFVRRNRSGVLAGGVVAAALVAAIVATTSQMMEARRQRDEARVQRDRAVYQEQRADAQVEFQRLLLSEVGDRPITMREILDSGRSLLEREHAADPRFLGTILVQLATSYAELGVTEVRGELLARAESLALAGWGADRLASIRCEMADNLRMAGRYEEAWRVLAGADSLLRRSPDPRNEVSCLAIRAQLSSEAGSSSEAIAVSRRGLAIKDRLGERRDMEYIALLNTLGMGLDHEGRPREAVATFQRAIAAMDSSGRGGMLARAILRHDLAVALAKLGETAEAEDTFHEALERAIRGDPTGGIYWQPAIHYAEAALTQDHADSALKYFSQIVTQATRDTSLYWEGRGLFGVGRAQARLGRVAEARRARVRLEQILREYPKVRATDDQVPDARTLDGWVALAQGDTAAASVAFTAALQANGFFEGQRRLRLRPVALLAAESALALGDVEEALDLAGEALAIAAIDSLSESRSAGVGEARLIQARALLAKGDSLGARTHVTRAVTALRFGAGPEHRRTREAEALAIRLGP